MHLVTRWPRPLLLALPLLACGPGDPGADTTGTSDSDSTNPSDPSESIPTTGEDSSAVCTLCHTILEGDVSPSGNPQIDGFIVAVDQLRTAAWTLRAAFERDILDLGELYAISGGPVDANFVAQLIAAIQADLAAHTDSGLRVVHVAPRCHADIDTAAAAQRSCEVAGQCNVTPTSERPAVECAGLCLGECSGSCSGPLSCVVPAPSIACEGECAGACTDPAPGPCMGVCRGECLGQCALIASNGDCAGLCDGPCAGTCAPSLPTSCGGSCSGACHLEQGSAQCSGLATCAGTCDAGCTGECVGKATPPSASPDCEASAACQQQAAAQGSASLRCTPPIVEFQFTLSAGLDANARGEFVARMQVLERRAAAIMQDAARLGALVDGTVNGQLLFSPSPAADLAADLNTLISVGVGNLPIPAGRRDCTLTALQAAVLALSQTTLESSPTIAAQTAFVAFITAA